MSLQTSSHPKARSLIVFLLSVIFLGCVLTQFTDIQHKVHNLRAVDVDRGVRAQGPRPGRRRITFPAPP